MILPFLTNRAKSDVITDAGTPMRKTETMADMYAETTGGCWSAGRVKMVRTLALTADRTSGGSPSIVFSFLFRMPPNTELETL